MGTIVKIPGVGIIVNIPFVGTNVKNSSSGDNRNEIRCDSLNTNPLVGTIVKILRVGTTIKMPRVGQW